MTQSSRLVYAIAFLLAAAGFLLPLWPLCVVGILLAALSGRWLFGTIVGLLVDVAWGAPTGALHYLFFPFTLIAVLGALARAWGSAYVMDKNPQERL